MTDLPIEVVRASAALQILRTGRQWTGRHDAMAFRRLTSMLGENLPIFLRGASAGRGGHGLSRSNAPDSHHRDPRNDMPAGR
jgi:hypothetical protein